MRAVFLDKMFITECVRVCRQNQWTNNVAEFLRSSYMQPGALCAGIAKYEILNDRVTTVFTILIMRHHFCRSAAA